MPSTLKINPSSTVALFIGVNSVDCTILRSFSKSLVADEHGRIKIWVSLHRKLPWRYLGIFYRLSEERTYGSIEIDRCKGSIAPIDPTKSIEACKIRNRVDSI